MILYTLNIDYTSKWGFVIEYYIGQFGVSTEVLLDVCIPKTNNEFDQQQVSINHHAGFAQLNHGISTPD